MSLRATGKVTPLQCPTCEQRMSADDVNIELLIGICRNCDATVELAREGPTERGRPHRESPPAELLAVSAPPAGIAVREEGGELVLVRRWFQLSPQLIFLGLWCLVWDGFLVVWYGAGISMLVAGEGTAVIMLLFPILHLAIGVAMTYWLLASVVNHSIIRVDQTHLSVTHAPLPWKRPAPIPLQGIDQLYLVRKEGKNAAGFELVARRLDRTSEQILDNIHSDVQGRYLEQRLEAWLGLTDQEVDGEYNG